VLHNPEDIFMMPWQGDRDVPYGYQKKLYDTFSRPAQGRYPRVRHFIVGHWPTALKCAKYINMFTEFAER